MTTKKNGLGRGLNALLVAARTPTETQDPEKKEFHQKSEGAHPAAQDASIGLLEISLKSLQPGQYQPRLKFTEAELEGLADSIRSQGILQPLVVRKLNPSQDQKEIYEIIAGERRFRAAALAGLEKVPVIIKQVSDEAALAMALIENIQRENLNPLEEAIAIERLAKEFKLTHIAVAESLGKSRTAITNSLRLLSLADDVKVLLQNKQIEVGHAKVLLGLRGQEQSDIARQVVTRNLTVRETERLVAKQLLGVEEPFIKRQNLDPDVRRLQESLSDKLGARLEIQQNQQGKGKLVIHYNSLEELEGILDHIQ